jgi:hypothetical protein
MNSMIKSFILIEALFQCRTKMIQILKRLFIVASNTDFQRLKLENMKKILILVSTIIKLTLTFISSTIILMLKRY